MPPQLDIESIRNRIPVRYRIHILIRGFMILLSGAIAAYSVYFIAFHVRGDTPLFFKLLPFVIFFVGMDALLKHLLGLNSVTFWDEQLQLAFLAKKSILIPYDKIRSIELQRNITYYLYIYYTDENAKDQTFRTKASFPKILEIILGIYELAPNLILTEKMKQTCEYLSQNKREG